MTLEIFVLCTGTKVAELKSLLEKLNVQNVRGGFFWLFIRAKEKKKD